MDGIRTEARPDALRGADNGHRDGSRAWHGVLPSLGRFVRNPRARRRDEAGSLGCRVAATELPSNPTCAARARHFVRATLATWGLEHLTPEATLLASELTTNALVHAGGPCDLVLVADAERLRLEVSDADSRSAPCQHADELAQESGRGLALVEELSARWGTRRRHGLRRGRTGKVVWCELALADPDESPEHASDGTPET